MTPRDEDARPDHAASDEADVGRAKIDALLTGVSETALLTLRLRAAEARRPDGVIDDPQALRLLDALDHDFDKFGSAGRQEIALRAVCFDTATRAYLAEHPRATVVALAEGLQTSFWRLDDGRVGHDFRWRSVDFPAVTALREQVLPASPRVSTHPGSALDFSWADGIDAADGVFVTAEGLLMYLQPHESMAVIEGCAQRFPGGEMMFDLPPWWLTALGRRGMFTTRRYRIPPMPFSLSSDDRAALPRTVPGVTAVRDVAFPAGRGLLRGALGWVARQAPILDPARGALTLLEFG